MKAEEQIFVTTTTTTTTTAAGIPELTPLVHSREDFSNYNKTEKLYLCLFVLAMKSL